MKIYLLSGFLGSGKSTAIQQACNILLQQGKRVGVITNDQGIRLVDSGFFNNFSIPTKQVINGCFCCNYNALDDNIQSLINNNNPHAIFAESVGSCTDIVATVVKPLLKFRDKVQVTVSTFADARLLLMLIKGDNNLFDDEVNYIYYKQLEEAGIIIINKTDLINNNEFIEIQQWIQKQYSNKTVLYQNSLDMDNIKHWLQAADAGLSATLPSLQVNYDTYGTGEAKLAWLDEEVEIYSSSNNAMQIAIDLMHAIYRNLQAKQYAIGHLKFLLDNSIKVSYTLTTQPGPIDINNDRQAIKLLINARVQTEPKLLSLLIDKTIEEMAAITGSKIIVNHFSAFQPGYPRPTYRLLD